MADRYLYVPLAGVGLLAAALAHRLYIQCSSGFAVALLAAAGLVLLSAEYAANVRRQIIWQEPATLWTDVLRQFPRTAQAHLGMANVHYRAGDYRAARTSAAEAALIGSSRWADALALRAICEWKTGDRAAAVQSFQKARHLSFVYADHEAMGLALIWSPEQLSILRGISRAVEP
jgi:tetratricopeptide (TPR) repeat protein